MTDSGVESTIERSHSDARGTTPRDHMISLLSGGFAGTVVDVTLFPLDTIKTRMQSSRGFMASGGFRGIYRGLGPAALGSAPTAALFFVTYEASKSTLLKKSPNTPEAVVHMLSASLGELLACLLRVPTEVVKQRMQTQGAATFFGVVKKVHQSAGIKGFYAGFSATIMREIPFSLIQFPLYEAAKRNLRESTHNDSSIAAALCGSASGAIAAAATTPMDVAKTRLMLGADKHGVAYRGFASTLSRVYKEGGVRLLFAGVVPRVTWIGIGGFVFFGAYERMRAITSQLI
jgi:solute carrier family 25 S-adenosylmethionine transporter 26